MPIRFLLAFVLIGACAVTRPADSNPIPASAMKLWKEPAKPCHIAGPIYFVGTRGLGIYLITASKGHILIDGGMAESAERIEKSIQELGFKLSDTRQLLITQGHFDHVGTLAYFKDKTHANLAVMTGDDELLKSGGKADYLFASNDAFHYEPVTPDRILHDGDKVTLGEVTLTARHTPGHTRGCTTWLTTIQDHGKSYSVVFAGSGTVNPGTRLVNNPSYPGIAADYRRSFEFLDSLHPDIFLGAHTDFFNFESKRRRAETEGAQAYVDPAGFHERVAAQRATFEKLVAKENE